MRVVSVATSQRGLPREGGAGRPPRKENNNEEEKRKGVMEGTERAERGGGGSVCEQHVVMEGGREKMSGGAPEKELCLADGIPGIAGNAWIGCSTDYPVWFWTGAVFCEQHNLAYICSADRTSEVSPFLYLPGRPTAVPRWAAVILSPQRKKWL